MTQAARKRIRLRGIVQGVGFRPFVYNLAARLEVRGWVLNTSEGVLIEVEGAGPALAEFVGRVVHEAPPFAHIEDTEAEDIEPAGDADFTIRPSLGQARQFVLVSPDMATCEACAGDFRETANRRHGYPFTNCTDCGPRYTIIRDIPYDRPMTTMAAFRMCAACQAEYDDPRDRRFHAQPNACPVCGPTVRFQVSGVRCQVDSGSDTRHLAPDTFNDSSQNLESIREARRLLAAGGIVAIKGLGGFHLACDATNDDAVRELRQRKRHSDKPFAVMARDLAAAERFCEIGGAERRALAGHRRPVVILPRRPGAPVSPAVAPNNSTLGVMLPYTPLHHLLFADSAGAAPFTMLVMTSGNMSEEPIVTSNSEALERLAPIAGAFLLHDRDIYMRVDDSVVRVVEGRERTLRRSRGYTPYPIDLGVEMPEVLACGGELKNTFCLTKGRYALLSQHIGDLENYETLSFFRETLEQMKKLFRVEPAAVAYDLHPNYLSTRFALECSGVVKIGIQHHHAHVAACMAENRLRDKVIGVAFDGTGYGSDGQIWGGEFLIADYGGFERRAHFRYVPLPGGDQAVREPWRAALSYLAQALGDPRGWPELPLLGAVPARKRETVLAMIRRGINTVQTSSCGRLFDAVASILGLRHEINFEGQAAIDLEQAAAGGFDQRYPFEIEDGEPARIDMRPAIRAIVADVRAGKPAPFVAALFHNTVADAIVEVCGRLRRAEGLQRVCLSGGTFQNVYLLRRVLAGLRARGFDVYTHAKAPPNDGGIALGQAAIAAQLLRA
jgi:hydrogenase maturation protein HypF